MCVWVGIWKYLFFYYCSISFVTHVVPMKHNVTIDTNSDCSVTVLPVCASCVSAWFMLLSLFTGILKSYFSQYAITLLLQCLWRNLVDKLNKIYSQVKVIKSIASKCRYFKLKWKPFLKTIKLDLSTTSIFILNKHVNHKQCFLTANIIRVNMLLLL